MSDKERKEFKDWNPVPGPVPVPGDGLCAGAPAGGAGAGGSSQKARLETALLIELVRQRPCIWDRADPLYRSRADKDRAWRDLCLALDPSYPDMTRTQRRDFGLLICRKWANIRDSYKKYLNGSSRNSASGRPYVYASHLTFLDATYNKDHRGKIYYETKDSEDHDGDEQEWLSEVFVDMETGQGEPDAKRIKTEYSKIKDASNDEESVVSLLVKLIEKEEDEDRAFFKSITPAVKSLSDADKFLFRIRVMKILDVLKKKDKEASKSDGLDKDDDEDTE